MITRKSIFKNLPSAAPEIEEIQNPDPTAICPLCSTEIGQARTCYRVSEPAVLAHYRCEAVWVRAETAILLSCRRGAARRDDLAIAVRNGQVFGRVLNHLIETGRIERVEGCQVESYTLDTRADSERVVDLLQRAGGMSEDSIMSAIGLTGSRAAYILHRLVQSGRLVCHRQGLMPWYGVAGTREEAA